MGLVFAEPEEHFDDSSGERSRATDPDPKDTTPPAENADETPAPSPTPSEPSDVPEKPRDTKGIVGKLTEVADEMSDDVEEDEWDFDDDDYWDLGEGLPPWTAPVPVDVAGEPPADVTRSDDTPAPDATGTTAGDERPDAEPPAEPAPAPAPEPSPTPSRPPPEPPRAPPRTYSDLPTVSEPDYEETIVEDEDEDSDDGGSEGRSLPGVLLDTLAKMIGLDIFGDEE